MASDDFERYFSRAARLPRETRAQEAHFRANWDNCLRDYTGHLRAQEGAARNARLERERATRESAWALRERHERVQNQKEVVAPAAPPPVTQPQFSQPTTSASRLPSWEEIPLWEPMGATRYSILESLRNLWRQLRS